MYIFKTQQWKGQIQRGPWNKSFLMQRVLPELLKTRQTIQVGYAYGKLNTSKEKHFSLVIARSAACEQTCQRLTIQLEKRGLCFFLQILNTYFGVWAGGEKKYILIHVL